MGLSRSLALFACLLLAGSSLVAHQRAEKASPVPMIVETVEGCWVWVESLPAGGRVSWSGLCSDGERFAEGYGRLSLFGRAGVIAEYYDGPIRNGLKYGRGSEHRAGETYFGEFKSGRRAGEGYEFFPDGHYWGGFRNGKRSGMGMMVWPGGDSYRGGWREGLPHGYGEAFIATGRIAGQWYAGCLLDSRRTVSVATPLDRCLELIATYTDDSVGEAPRPWDVDMREGEVLVENDGDGGGCVPVNPGSDLRLCR